MVALETGPVGGRLHAHSLIGWERVEDDLFHDLWMRDLWSTWAERFGRARFERIRNSNAAAEAYAVKYVVKEVLQQQLWDIRTNGRTWYGGR